MLYTLLRTNKAWFLGLLSHPLFFVSASWPREEVSMSLRFAWRR